MIRIDYDAVSRGVVLSTDSYSVGWARLRRVLADRFEGADDLGAFSIGVPLWRYLNVRQAFEYHATRLGSEFAADPRLAEVVDGLESKNLSYAAAIATAPICDLHLREELAKRGFARARSATPEQIRNIAKLYAMRKGASFSVPGAGKTTEALAVFSLVRNEVTKLLVICPKNAFAAWEEQSIECFKSQPLEFTRLVGGETQIRRLLEGTPQAALITYQQFAVVSDLLSDFLSANSTVVILDESHKAKRGETGVIGRALLGIAHLADSKLILSGTPMPNSRDDLIPQLKFLFPELVIESGEKAAELIQQIYVRTTKRELNLPDVTRRLTSIPMGENQRRLYGLMCSELARDADRSLRSRDKLALRSLGKSVIRLLQVSSNPSLLLSSETFESTEVVYDILGEAESPKLDYVCSRVRELALQGLKVVVWTSFVENVEILALRLKDLRAEFIHGGVEAGSEQEEDTREAKLYRFRNDEHCYALIANPAACSEGISLHTVCHEAIYLDRNFNAAQYLQSEDRIHRIGLPPDQITNVEIVCCPNSIDEIVDARLRAKVEQMANVLNDDSLNIDPIPQDPDGPGIDDADVILVANHILEETVG